MVMNHVQMMSALINGKGTASKETSLWSQTWIFGFMTENQTYIFYV